MFDIIVRLIMALALIWRGLISSLGHGTTRLLLEISKVRFSSVSLADSPTGQFGDSEFC